MEYRALEYFKYAAAPSHFGVPLVFHRVAIPAAAIAGAPTFRPRTRPDGNDGRHSRNARTRYPTGNRGRDRARN